MVLMVFNKKSGQLILSYWSKFLSKSGTLIYIDDSNRKLENYCIKKFYNNKFKKYLEKEMVV